MKVAKIFNDDNNAQEFVSKLEKAIDEKFESHGTNFATKIDLAETESRLTKAIYIVGIVQFIAILGSVLAIVNFMLK